MTLWVKVMHTIIDITSNLLLMCGIYLTFNWLVKIKNNLKSDNNKQSRSLLVKGIVSALLFLFFATMFISKSSSAGIEYDVEIAKLSAIHAKVETKSISLAIDEVLHQDPSVSPITMNEQEKSDEYDSLMKKKHQQQDDQRNSFWISILIFTTIVVISRLIRALYFKNERSIKSLNAKTVLTKILPWMIFLLFAVCVNIYFLPAILIVILYCVIYKLIRRRKALKSLFQKSHIIVKEWIKQSF